MKKIYSNLKEISKLNERKVMQFPSKNLFTNNFLSSGNLKNLKLNSFYTSRLYCSMSNKFFYTKQSFNFCNLSRLNFDKLEVSKEKENKESILIKDEEDLKKKEANKNFSVDENIIEFSPELNWEEVVMKSEIPVLVDCYAE